MARQTIPGEFSVTPASIATGGLYGNLCMFDPYGPVTISNLGLNEPEFTPGCTVASKMGTGAGSGQGPQINQRWSLLSFSVTGSLVFVNQYGSVGGTGPGAAFGQLGKIVAGVVLDGSLDATLPGETFPFQALVSDETLAVDLWDPATDPMPPTFLNQIVGGQQPKVATPGATLQVSASLSLPLPIDIFSGTLPVIGVWMNPSLLGYSALPATLGNSIGLGFTKLRYSFTYDDGL